MLKKDSLRILSAALERLDAGFEQLAPMGAVAEDTPAVERVLIEAAQRLQDNFP